MIHTPLSFRLMRRRKQQLDQSSGLQKNNGHQESVTWRRTVKWLSPTIGRYVWILPTRTQIQDLFVLGAISLSNSLTYYEVVVVPHYHCSPTLVPCRFLPRPPRLVCGVKRAGSKGARLTLLHSPSSTNSLIALPVAGAQAMPQQLCPALM